MMLKARTVRVILKALAIFAILNLAFAGLDPSLGGFSIYNALIPGRLRLPFDVYSNQSDDLQALLKTHVVSSPSRIPSEYRVFLLGDSQTWGARLTLQQTLTQQLNLAHLTACGRNLRFYNLATPYPSALKDFLVLHEGLQYRPDMVVWMVTAEGLLPWDQALDPIKGNPGPLLDVLHAYSLDGYASLIGRKPTFLDRTLAGQSRLLHGLALLQLSGAAWNLVGIDPASDLPFPPYEPLRLTLRAKTLDWNGIQPEDFDPTRLYMDVLPATRKLIGQLPVLVAAEPIFIVPDVNSGGRYNKLYPRWAYDRVMEMVRAAAIGLDWHHEDFHDLVPYNEFTDDVHHLTPKGETLLAGALAPQILKVACPAAASAAVNPN